LIPVTYKDHGGAIPSNVITLADTAASSRYLNYCRANCLKPHPARMPIGLTEFFIKFLTDPGDFVIIGSKEIMDIANGTIETSEKS
jgi:DNA modification methylase